MRRSSILQIKFYVASPTLFFLLLHEIPSMISHPNIVSKFARFLFLFTYPDSRSGNDEHEQYDSLTEKTFDDGPSNNDMDVDEIMSDHGITTVSHRPQNSHYFHTESPNRLDACSVESAEALHRGQQWRGYDENTLNRQPSCVDFAMSPVPTDRTSEYAGQDLFFQRVPSFTWSAATMPKQLAPESTGLHSVYRGSASASTESMEWPENKQTEFSEGASYGQPLFFRHGCMSASSSSHLEPDHGVNSAFADQSSGHSFEALEEQQRRDACRPLDDGNRRPPSHLDFAATPDEREYGAVSRSVSVQSLPRSMESAEQLQRDAMMHLDDVYSATAMQKYEEPSGSDAPDGGSYESQRLSGSESSHGESDAGDDRHLTTLESAEHFQRSLPCQVQCMSTPIDEDVLKATRRSSGGVVPLVGNGHPSHTPYRTLFFIFLMAVWCSSINHHTHIMQYKKWHFFLNVQEVSIPDDQHHVSSWASSCPLKMIFTTSGPHFGAKFEETLVLDLLHRLKRSNP